MTNSNLWTQGIEALKTPSLYVVLVLVAIAMGLAIRHLHQIIQAAHKADKDYIATLQKCVEDRTKEVAELKAELAASNREIEIKDEIHQTSLPSNLRKKRKI
ncbi:MAG: hypothetical protein ACRCWR_06135 [Saezia sp.]